MGRANAQDTQHWKRPWGLCGVGLRLKEQKGPSLKRAGDLTWEPSRLPGLEWVGQMPSSPLLLLRSGVWEGPSRLRLLISLASLLCSQDPCGLEGALKRWGAGLGAQQAPQSQWSRQSPSTPLLLFLESPSHLPLLTSPASGVPILSGLYFSYPLGPPTSYQFTVGFLPSPWGLESSISGRHVP